MFQLRISLLLVIVASLSPFSSWFFGVGAVGGRFVAALGEGDRRRFVAGRLVLFSSGD